MRPDVCDNPTYLIGFAEAWATPEVCFSLQATGARIACFCRHNSSLKFARLNFVEYHPVNAPESDLNVDELTVLIARLRPEVIIPCDDAALRVLGRLNGFRGNALVPAAEVCQFAMDKWAQVDAARAAGFAVMRTQLVENETDVARFPVRPAIVKPRHAVDIRGAGLDKGRAFVLENDELSRDTRAALFERAYLIQEYKLGVGEGIFGIARSGKIYAGFGH
jgi:hypothetical protein